MKNKSKAAEISLMENESLEEFLRAVEDTFREVLLTDEEYRSLFDGVKIQEYEDGESVVEGVWLKIVNADSFVSAVGWGMDSRYYRVGYTRNASGDFVYGQPEQVYERVEYVSDPLPGDEPADYKGAVAAQKKTMMIAKSEVAMNIVAVEDAVETPEVKAKSKVKFILTHVGMNRNRDVFTPEELERVAETIVGKKIDLLHSDGLLEIVGKVISAEYIDDGDNSRVECEGELFDDKLPSAQHVAKLIEESLIGHVSMECGYASGECTECGNVFENADEICEHMEIVDGMIFAKPPAMKIMKGVEFTGVGLLDKQGADAGATINMAAVLSGRRRMKMEGTKMSGTAEKKESTSEKSPVNVTVNFSKAEEAKKEEPVATEKETKAADEDKDAIIAEKQAEIEALKEANQKLQDMLDQANKESEAMVRESGIKDLLSLYEQAGMSLDEETVKAKKKDFVKMSPDAFAAHLSAIKEIAEARKAEAVKAEAVKTAEPTEATLSKPHGEVAQAALNPARVSDSTQGENKDLASVLKNFVETKNHLASGK